MEEDREVGVAVVVRGVEDQVMVEDLWRWEIRGVVESHEGAYIRVVGGRCEDPRGVVEVRHEVVEDHGMEGGHEAVGGQGVEGPLPGDHEVVGHHGRTEGPLHEVVDPHGKAVEGHHGNLGDPLGKEDIPVEGGCEEAQNPLGAEMRG